MRRVWSGGRGVDGEIEISGGTSGTSGSIIAFPDVTTHTSITGFMNTNVALRQEKKYPKSFDFLLRHLEALDVCHGMYHTRHCFYLETGPYSHPSPSSPRLQPVACS